MVSGKQGLTGYALAPEEGGREGGGGEGLHEIQ